MAFREPQDLDGTYDAIRSNIQRLLARQPVLYSDGVHGNSRVPAWQPRLGDTAHGVAHRYRINASLARHDHSRNSELESELCSDCAGVLHGDHKHSGHSHSMKPSEHHEPAPPTSVPTAYAASSLGVTAQTRASWTSSDPIVYTRPSFAGEGGGAVDGGAPLDDLDFDPAVDVEFKDFARPRSHVHVDGMHFVCNGVLKDMRYSYHFCHVGDSKQA